MYSDRIAEVGKRSVKERLDGSTDEGVVRARQINGKRQRQNEDKWQHDLYEDDSSQVKNPKVGVRDLRLKLQKKGSQPVNQSGKSSVTGGVRDLREKLSGMMHSQLPNTDTGHIAKNQSSAEVVKPARKRAKVEGAVSEAKTASIPVASKGSQKKTDTVDGLLRSLGLEKYSITFQAEEVDMTALMHMNDEDLKALGIPMGPRKKILLSLDSRE
ncbi:hypothetical protein Scep_010601 [Stephania cephalantha]|uniref:SAM domain-containing protein n=1 Tax=Stephania cephalantha TaxID=152367 RepID=A0AAP0PH76_9MAGN